MELEFVDEAQARVVGCVLANRLGLRACTASSCLTDEVDELADRHTALQGMAELFLTTHDVVIAATHARSRDDAGLFQIAHDLLDGALGDPDPRCHVTQQYSLISR